MTKRNKKGFTIVELVIVIAIVAILAAILIPTFSSVIDRANESADIQTVRQINVILAAEAIEKGTLTLEDVLKILDDYKFTAENLKPAGDNHEFMWDSDKNMIILVEKDGDTATLIYPVEEGENTNITSQITQNIIQAIGGGATPTGTPITANTDNLEELLAAGENFYLDDDIVIDEEITIANNVTIDLNGKNLTIGDPGSAEVYASVSLTGSLTIKNSDKNKGRVIIEEAVESWPEVGICVEGPDDEMETSGGILNLENVNIEGNRGSIIDNWGTVFITNSSVTVNDYYYGLANYGGSVTITGGSVTTSVGYADNAIQSTGGTTTINGTTFSGKYNDSTIKCTGGTLNLCGVTTTQYENYCDVKATNICVVNIDDPEDKTIPPCSTFENPMELGGTSTIHNGIYNSLITYIGADKNEEICCTIKGGLFNGGFTLTTYGNVYIEGGTFTERVSAIDAGSNSYDNGKNKGIVIKGGTFTARTYNEDGTYTDGTIVHCEGKSEIYIKGGSFIGKLECIIAPNEEKDRTYIYIYIPEASDSTEVSYNEEPLNRDKLNDFISHGHVDPVYDTKEGSFHITWCSVKNCQKCTAEEG